MGKGVGVRMETQISITHGSFTLLRHRMIKEFYVNHRY